MTLTAVLPKNSQALTSRVKPSMLIVNKLMGLIVACRHPHRRHVQVRTADGIHVTVHDPVRPGHTRALSIGQQLSLRIPPHAVTISPERPINATEENVWPARVVLPAGQERGSLLVVKIIGHPWTVTSTQQGWPRSRPLRAWDRVTVRIRPEACVIDQRYPDDSHLRPRLLTESSALPADLPRTRPDRRPPYPALKGRETLSCVPCPPCPEDHRDPVPHTLERHHSRNE
ncbi:MAG: hypothetical protein JSR62_06585 [Nitrospira sp.]|nr:hypothetical protein [Nitrospira sp.]